MESEGLRSEMKSERLRSEMEGEGLREGGYYAMGDKAGNFLSMLFIQSLKPHF